MGRVNTAGSHKWLRGARAEIPQCVVKHISKRKSKNQYQHNDKNKNFTTVPLKTQTDFFLTEMDLFDTNLKIQETQI